MGKKEFMNGLYPEANFRELRLSEIKKQIDVLVLNREELNRQLNLLIFEARVLEEMDQLEKGVNGEINIQFQESKPE